MKSDPDKLTKRHQELVHSDNRKVTSHVQRQSGEWYINTLMLEGCSAPFRYKRTQPYQSLQGQRVNLTYYRDVEQVAGMSMEVMRVVRVRVS